MKRPSLLSQIVALNLLMVTAGILVVIFAAGFDFSISDQRWEFLVLAMAMLLTFLLNTLLLRRRFEPLERLLAMMERVDLSRPGRRLELDPDMAGVSIDIQRLAATFNRMLERLENERRRSGELVLRAQEEERRRIARDLHDEVNQSLTALLLRIEAAPRTPRRSCARSSRRPSSWPTRRWASCSTSPASCARPRSTTTAWSRRSRPTSATSTGAARRARASGRTRGWATCRPTHRWSCTASRRRRSSTPRATPAPRASR